MKYLLSTDVLPFVSAEQFVADANEAGGTVKEFSVYFSDPNFEHERSDFEADLASIFVDGEPSDTLSLNDGRVIEAPWEAYADAQRVYAGKEVELYMWRASWQHVLRLTYGQPPAY